jgi:hypothetical protein
MGYAGPLRRFAGKLEAGVQTYVYYTPPFTAKFNAANVDPGGNLDTLVFDHECKERSAQPATGADGVIRPALGSQLTNQSVLL